MMVLNLIIPRAPWTVRQPVVAEKCVDCNSASAPAREGPSAKYPARAGDNVQSFMPDADRASKHSARVMFNTQRPQATLNNKIPFLSDGVMRASSGSPVNKPGRLAVVVGSSVSFVWMGGKGRFELSEAGKK